jgi:predicted ArsR family transcriptional regulator
VKHEARSRRAKPGRSTLERKPSQIKVDRLLKEIRNRPMHPAEVAEFLCVSMNSARRYVRILHDEGRLYIKRYLRNGTGGTPKAVYALGPGKDASKPVPHSRKENHKRWYEKLRRDHPDKFITMLAKARLRRAMRKPVAADPMLSWIPRQDLREAA